MESIPGAALSQEEINSINVRHPESSIELTELNRRITVGEDTDEDLKRFIRLLWSVGELEKAEQISRAQVRVRGDEYYELYTPSPSHLSNRESVPN